MNRNLSIRLAFAAHRVADTLPDEEVKQEIKESANTVLADLIVFLERDGVSSEKRKALIPQLMRQIDVLLVYLDRAKREGWVQADNFSVLETEYGRLKDFLEVFESIETAEEEPEPAATIQAEEPVEAKEKPVKSQALRQISRKEMGGPSRTIENGEGGDLTERQRKIIDFLKRKDSAQVWELQKVLPQVTKRTLRRDLDSLLQLNLVQRKGEWNSVVYELKQKDAVTR